MANVEVKVIVKVNGERVAKEVLSREVTDQRGAVELATDSHNVLSAIGAQLISRSGL